MKVFWAVLAFVVALASAVGCKGARRSVAPATTTTPLPSGTCGDVNEPLRKAQENARLMLALAKKESGRDPKENARAWSLRSARQVNAINAKDGIDEDEAYAIAQMYFQMYLGDCGEPARPIRHGRFWTSGGHVGLLDDPLPAPIRVDARTGGVQGPHGRAYASFAEFGRAWISGRW